MPPKQTLILARADMTKEPSPIYTYTCMHTYLYIYICTYICEVEMTKSLFTGGCGVCVYACVCVCVYVCAACINTCANTCAACASMFD